MEYITPLHMATESSTTPKSVMNTIVGLGGFWACAQQTASRSVKARSKTILASGALQMKVVFRKKVLVFMTLSD
jgi:hypothetical protein